MDTELKQKDPPSLLPEDLEGLGAFDFGNEKTQLNHLPVAPIRSQDDLRYKSFTDNEEEHHFRLSKHAATLWESKLMTDVIIKLRKVEYSAHKTVLSCYSKYFKEILVGSDPNLSVINLKFDNISNEAFKSLMIYMYTGHLPVTVQTVGDIYTAAHKLGMSEPLVQCGKILTGKSLNHIHSVYVYVTAKRLGLEDAMKRAMKNMSKRFEQIVGSQEFLDLSCSQVIEYLSMEKLATRSEVIVFLGALKWLSVDFLEREQFATDVLECVRFSHMSLEEVLACHHPPILPGIMEIHAIKDMLLKATCFVAAKSINDEKRFSRYSGPERTYLIEKESIVLWDPNIFDPERYTLYAKEVAATKIQAVLKGHLTRKNLDRQKDAAAVIQKAFRKLPNIHLPGELHDFESAADRNRLGSDEDSDNRYDWSNHSESSGDGGKTSPKKIIKEISPAKDSKLRESFGNIKDVLSRPSPKDLEDFHQDSLQQEGTNKPSNLEPPEKPKRAYSNTLKSMASHIKEDSLQQEGTNKPSNLEPPEKPKRAYSKTLKLMATHIKETSPKKIIDKLTPARDSNLRKSFGDLLDVLSRRDLRDLHQEKNGETDKTLSSEKEDLTDPRCKGIIVLSGGFIVNHVENPKSGNLLLLYDPAKNKWNKLGEMPRPLHHHTAIHYNGVIYCIGGCDPRRTMYDEMLPLNSAYGLDLSTMMWKKLAPMNHARMYHSIAEANGKIYVVGGQDDNDKVLDIVEVYEPEDDDWHVVTERLPRPLMGAGVCTFEGQIWIVGGVGPEGDEEDLKALKTVTCFDPFTEQFSSDVPSLPSPLAFAGVTVFRRQVLVIGGTEASEGHSSEDTLTSTDMTLLYNVGLKKWVTFSPLTSPRHFTLPLAFESSLYVLGGLTTFQIKAMRDVLWFKEDTEEWIKCEPIPYPLCGFSPIWIPRENKRS